MNHQSLSSFIWSMADLLRGDYRQSDYGKVILPFTVLRRMDCVLSPTKEAVLIELSNKQRDEVKPELFLLRKSGQSFYNTSPLDMKKLMGDQDHIKENLFAYIQGFSSSVRDIFEHFDFFTQIERLSKCGLLYQVAEKFAKIDLHPESVDNTQMGLIFEELLRKFAEISNETAGEHFTPREVIKLMVNLLFIEDDEILSKSGVVRTLYDPTAGTGGMLSVASEHLAGHNPQAQLTVSGQELNPESYAICKADMLIKGQEIANIIYGNTLSEDGHQYKKFDYSTIIVERPLRDETGQIVLGTKGKLKGKSQPDTNLRDTENVPLGEDIDAYFKREVLPHAPDAWIDHEKTKVGYEIPINRYFYVFKPPRMLNEIDAELKDITSRILAMLEETGVSA